MKAQLKVKTLEKVLKERTRILTEMENEIIEVVTKLRNERSEAEEALKRNKLTKNVVQLEIKELTNKIDQKKETELE